MVRTAIAIVVAGRLVLAPWAAAQETPAAGPIAAAAAREAERAVLEPRDRDPMPPGLKWTGIGLLLHGGAVATTGLIYCSADACGPDPEIGFGVAAASLVAGAIVLHVADRKRAPAAPEPGEPDDDGPIATAAPRAARQGASTRPPMPTGLKWTGVSLLGASVLPVTIAELGDCIPDGSRCRRERRRAYIAGGAMAGTGALLLAIAEAKRGTASRLPSLVVGGGRAVVSHRIRF